MKRESRDCSKGTCTERVLLGYYEFSVVTRTKLRDASDLRGDKETGADVAKDVVETIFSFTKLGGNEDEIGLGMRRVVSIDASLALHCDVAWLEDVRTRGWTEEKRTRNLEGARCVVTTLQDSVPRWRFERGMPATKATLARFADTLQWTSRRGTKQLEALPMRLERLDRSRPDSVRPYRLVLERHGSASLDKLFAWHFARDDSTAIGTFFWRKLGASTLELADAATPEEQAVLRMIAVMLELPLRPTH